MFMSSMRVEVSLMSSVSQIAYYHIDSLQPFLNLPLLQIGAKIAIATDLSWELIWDAKNWKFVSRENFLNNFIAIWCNLFIVLYSNYFIFVEISGENELKK